MNKPQLTIPPGWKTAKEWAEEKGYKTNSSFSSSVYKSPWKWERHKIRHAGRVMATFYKEL